MKILIDGDSCSRIAETERIAKRHNLATHVYCDTSHEIRSNRSTIHVVDKGTDSADFRILKDCEAGDIVVTNDGGLAALVLAKRGKAINTYGRPYTDRMIMDILTARHFGRKMRKCGQKTKGTGFKDRKYNYDAELTSLIHQPVAKVRL